MKTAQDIIDEVEWEEAKRDLERTKEPMKDSVLPKVEKRLIEDIVWRNTGKEKMKRNKGFPYKKSRKKK